MEIVMRIKSLFILLVVLLASFNLYAVQLNLAEDTKSESGRFEEDYIFTGQSLEFSGKANDLFTFTEFFEFNGQTKLAIIGAASKMNINGTVGNGIKAAGRSITIGGNTTGTSFLAAENLTFEETSQTTGAIFAGARKILLKGKMNGDLRAGAGEISIQNEIYGNVTVHTGRLTISENGRIVGNLEYHSDQPLTEEEAARVSGEISFKEREGGHFDDSVRDDLFDNTIGFSLVFKIAFAVLGFLLLLFPIGRVLEKQVNRKEITSLALWGLLPIFIYPSAIVISIILIITIPLGISLILAFLPILFVTKIIGITIIGGLIVNALNWQSKNRFLYFLIGVIPYSLLSLIPYFGFILLVLVSSIGCGKLLSSLFQKQLA